MYQKEMKDFTMDVARGVLYFQSFPREKHVHVRAVMYLFIKLVI